MIKLVSHPLAPLLGAGAAAVLAFAISAPALPPDRCIASAVLAGTMAAIALHDLSSMRVPNSLNLLTAASGLLMAVVLSVGRGSDAASAAAYALVNALICGGMLLAVRESFRRLRGEDGLGLGDVKLGAAAGIWLGWELFVRSLLLASVAGLIFVAVMYLVGGRWNRLQRIPFAAAFAPAIWVCWYADQSILFGGMPGF